MPRPAPRPKARRRRPSRSSRGSRRRARSSAIPRATVRMLQFEDLQCPICKQYTDDAFPAIVNEYVRPGRLKIDFRGLAFLGPDSLKALRIAVAAGFQNKLWQVVGLFYENQGAENSGWVTDSLIDEILAEVPGLDAAKVKADANSGAVAKEITAFQAEATDARASRARRRSSSASASTSRTRSSPGLRAERVPPGARRRAQGMTGARRPDRCAARRCGALSRDRAGRRRLHGLAGNGARRRDPAARHGDRQKTATVTLIQFEDLGCTHCSDVHEGRLPDDHQRLRPHRAREGRLPRARRRHPRLRAGPPVHARRVAAEEALAGRRAVLREPVEAERARDGQGREAAGQRRQGPRRDAPRGRLEDRSP